MKLVLAIIIGYIVLTNIVGIVAAKRVKNSADFLVGSGKMPWILVVAILCGAWEGSGSSMGLSQQAYELGIYPGFYTAFFTVGLIVAGLYIVPFARRLGILTLPELIGKMFGPAGRWVTSIVWLMQDIIIFSMQFLGGAGIFSALFGLPTWQGILITLVGVAGYMILGGMIAASWTNLMHSVIMFGTAAISIPLVMKYGEGFQHAIDTLPESYFTVAGMGWPLLLGWFLSVTSGPIIHQLTFQASVSAKSEKEARKSFFVSAGIIVFYGIPFAILGVVAKAYLPEGTNSLLALPSLAVAINPVFGGLLLAGVVAALLSTAAPMLFSSPTIFINDIYLPLRPHASEKEKLLASRCAAVGVLIIGLAIALVVKNINTATVFAFTFRLVILVCIIIPWLIGGAKFITKEGGIIGIVTGVAVAMIAGPVLQLGLPPMYWALGGALVGLIVGSFITRKRNNVVDDVWTMMRKASSLEDRIEEI